MTHPLLALVLISGLLPGVFAQETEQRWTTLVFLNGQEVRGRIIPPRPNYRVIRTPTGEIGYDTGRPGAAPARTTGTIDFRTEDGTRTRYQLAHIREVILPDEREAEQADELIDQIRFENLPRGDLVGALERATELHHLNPDDPEVRQMCWDAALAVYNEAKRRTDVLGELDRAFEMWDALEIHLQQTGLAMVSPTARDPRTDDLREEYEEEYRNALRDQVESLIRRAGAQRTPDEALLYRAYEYNERLLGRSSEQDFEARLTRIDIAEALGERGRALEIAQELQRDMASMSGMGRRHEQVVRDRIAGLGATVAVEPRTGASDPLVDLLGAPDRGTPQATSTPPPPTGRPAPPRVQTPIAAPAPAPSPGLPSPGVQPNQTQSSGSWTDLRTAVTQGEWRQAYGVLRAWAGANSAILTPVAIVLGALMLLWYLPHRLALKAARRGSITASLWAPRIKVFGPLALAGWMASPILAIGSRRGRKAKEDLEHACPHCSGDLGRLDLYQDMNFNACPHCNAPITPVFELNDYVNFLVKAIDRARGGKMLGDDSMSDAVARESMLRLVRAVITLAVRRRASDIHVEATGDGLDVRARIDGILSPLEIHISKAVEKAFISAIKVMANMDITERRKPQDGRIEMHVDGAQVDFRLNTSPTGLGEKIAIRVLDIRTVQVPLEMLGFSEIALPLFKKAVVTPHGMLLVTGPTGCGKSTTLYVALNEINNGSRNIVTLEDPIEFVFRGLNQHQVNLAANFTFATGLRSIIRQDPDVIMVGEIRDNETAGIAVDAATTGHLMMSTLHTIDAAGAYARLTELGVDPRRFAPCLLLIISQRLIRLICTHCRTTGTPDPETLRALELEVAGHDITFHRGKGCEQCGSSGYLGRTGIFEVMEIVDELRTLMESRAATAAVRDAARRMGMRTLHEEGIVKIMEGVTTPQEVLRVIT